MLESTSSQRDCGLTQVRVTPYSRATASFSAVIVSALPPSSVYSSRAETSVISTLIQERENALKPIRSRIASISEEIRREVDNIIREDVRDPRIQGTYSLVRAETTRDLRYCKIRISIMEEEFRKPMMAALKNAAGFIRRELGGRWAMIVVVWQCIVAWVAALLVRAVLMPFM